MRFYFSVVLILFFISIYTAAAEKTPIARPLDFSTSPVIENKTLLPRPEPLEAKARFVPPEESASQTGLLPPELEDFYNDYIIYRLDVGARLKYFELLDAQRGQPNNGSFFGTVTMLKERRNDLPLNLYIQYKIRPEFGLGIGYDKFGVVAGDWGIDGGGGPDGTASFSGPLFYVFGCYPTKTRFTPFGEVGVAFYSASFDPDAGWIASNPKSVELDSTHGYYLAAGCDMQIGEQFAVDLYSRYMYISDVAGEWFLMGNKRGDVVLTPSYLAIGLGARFMF